MVGDDVLSASSLLLAVVAVLFGVWHDQIQRALDFKFDRIKDNRGPERPPIWAVARAKAWPLAVGAWLTALVFVPRAFGIAAASARCWHLTRCDYDDVAAALLLTQAFVAVIAIYSTAQAIGLIVKLSRSYR